MQVCTYVPTHVYTCVRIYNKVNKKTQRLIRSYREAYSLNTGGRTCKGLRSDYLCPEVTRVGTEP